MIAVLALQGAFAEHEQVLDRLGEEWFEIRNKTDLERPFDGLIIPGGESTVIGKLLDQLGMTETLKRRIGEGLPVFGTCAGLILLAHSVVNDGRTYLATLPATVERNAYGRQLGSFSAHGEFADVGDVPMEFIRAPVITELGEGAEKMAEVGGKIVAVRCGSQLGTPFHPELTGDDRIHGYFLKMVKDGKRKP